MLEIKEKSENIDSIISQTLFIIICYYLSVISVIIVNHILLRCFKLLVRYG